MTELEETDRPARWSAWFCTSFCFLCTVFWLLCTFLLLSIIFVVLKIPLGIEVPSIGILIIIIYHKIFLPSILFGAEIIKSLFPWPAFAALVFAIILWDPKRFTAVTSEIGKLELPGGIKFERRSPPKELQKELGEAARSVEKTNKEVEEVYKAIKSFAAELRERFDILQLVSELAVQVAQQIGPSCPEDFRLTLYVPDFIFNDRLYQFTEYYDKKGKRVSNDRAGRVYSIRYGIIGRVWRSGIAEIEGNLISQEEREQAGADVERFIARHWGFTLEEALHAREYNSYGAIRMERADRPVGLLYFDSKSREAFGDADALRESIQALLRNGPLTGALSEIKSEVASWSGRLEIYRNPK